MARHSPLAERIAVSLQRQCEAFNLLHPVGSRVRAWTGLMHDGPGIEGTIREPAYVLNGHTAVVFIDGCRSVVSVTHVEGRD